jgi:hypothetical protein
MVSNWTNKWYLIRRYNAVDMANDFHSANYWTIAFGGTHKEDAEAYAKRLGLTEENGMVVDARALTATLMLLNR